MCDEKTSIDNVIVAFKDFIMKSIVLPFLLTLIFINFTTVSDSPQQKNSQNKPSFPVLDLGLLGKTSGMNTLAEKAVLIQGDTFISQFFKDQDLNVFVGSDIANPFNHPEWYSFAMLDTVFLNVNVDSYLVLMSSNNKKEEDSFFYLVNEVKGKVTSIINIAILSKDVFVGCQVNRDDEGNYLIIRRGSLSISDIIYPYDEDIFEPDKYSIIRLLDDGTIRGANIPPPGGKDTYVHKDFNDYNN